MSFDYITYSLLKKKISSVAGGIKEAKIENGRLILIGIDGVEYDCGDLGLPNLDDNNIANNSTWSSQKIVEYYKNNSYNESQIKEIALEVAEDAISEFMPSTILGGKAIHHVDGGEAVFDEQNIIYGMDADEEPIGVDITLKE